MQPPQPTVPTHQFVHTPQLNAQMPVNVPVSVSAVTSGGFVFPVTIGNMPPLVSISSGIPPLQTTPLNTYTCHANPVVCTQMNNAPRTATKGRGTNPPLQHIPKFDGTRKRLGAKTRIADLVQSKTLYGLLDSQMIPVATFLCTEQARKWVKIQPDDKTWEQFKTAFLREYGEKNQDQLLMEMRNHSQGEASVGEYATTMQRYLKQLDGISPQRQMSYFVKNLNMGLRKSTFAGHPKNLSEAIELARDAENMYISLLGQQKMGKQVSSLQRFVHNLWSAQRAGGIRTNAMNPAMNSAATGINNQIENVGQGVNTPVQDRPCPACDEMGHIPLGIAGIGGIGTSLAASFGRSIGSNVPRILSLYLFRTITLLLRIRYGWREPGMDPEEEYRTIMMNQICKTSVLLKRRLT
jgi:hypothetical protein